MLDDNVTNKRFSYFIRILTLWNQLYGTMHYKIGVTYVFI